MQSHSLYCPFIPLFLVAKAIFLCHKLTSLFSPNYFFHPLSLAPHYLTVLLPSFNFIVGTSQLINLLRNNCLLALLLSAAIQTMHTCICRPAGCNRQLQFCITPNNISERLVYLRLLPYKSLEIITTIQCYPCRREQHLPVVGNVRVHSNSPTQSSSRATHTSCQGGGGGALCGGMSGVDGWEKSDC